MFASLTSVDNPYCIGLVDPSQSYKSWRNSHPHQNIAHGGNDGR